ncbi:MAG: alpha-hydroxy acid oxidase [Thermoleophilaceae bacterium]
MELPPTVADFEARAAELLDPGPLGYYAGGAGDEHTLRDNVAAWSRLAIRPRVMADVSAIDPSTTLLGERRRHPIVVAPTAFQRLATPDAECATVRAALATDTIYTLSTLATSSCGEVAEAAPECRRWFQLYVFKDRGVTRELVSQAVEHGYEALVVTVDMPVVGVRERDLRSGFVVGDATAVPMAAEGGATGTLSMPELFELIDRSLSWDDIEDFASASGLPVIVKGVIIPEDARRACESGAAGVVVSNHGGRQLDTVLSGADALPGVVEEVGDEIEVLVDGGIRRGTDVLKALALGARAVLVGRPILWGLACGGEAGARRVLEILRAEFETALALAGCPSAADLDETWVTKAPWTP